MLSLSAECFCGEGPDRGPELIGLLGNRESAVGSRSSYRPLALGEGELLCAAEAVSAVDGDVAEGTAPEPERDVGTAAVRLGRRVGEGSAEGLAITEAARPGASRVGDGTAEGGAGAVVAAGGAAGTTRTGAAGVPDSSSGVITAAATASASPPPTAVRRRRRRSAPRRMVSKAPGGGSRTTGPDPSSPASRSSRSPSDSSMGVIKVSPQPAAQ